METGCCIVKDKSNDSPRETKERTAHMCINTAAQLWLHWNTRKRSPPGENKWKGGAVFVGFLNHNVKGTGDVSHHTNDFW